MDDLNLLERPEVIELPDSPTSPKEPEGTDETLVQFQIRVIPPFIIVHPLPQLREASRR